MAPPPRISVVVPVYNGGAAFAACLGSLRAQDHGSYELIVVDDASTDGSRALAEEHADRTILLPGRSGPGRARNAGAEVARGAILAFTDADCVLPPGWLSRIDEVLTDQRLGAVAGGYDRSLDPSPVARFNLHELAWRRRSYGATVDTAPGANLAVRRALFEASGGFPCDLGYASTEDMVFTLRLSRLAPLAWDASNPVGHHFRGTLRGYLGQQVRFARPLLKVYLTHRALFSARSHHPRSGWSAMASVPALAGGLLLLPLPALGLPALGAGLLLAWAPERGFLRFLREREGRRYAAKALPLLVARNAAWFVGAAVGVVDLPALGLTLATGCARGRAGGGDDDDASNDPGGLAFGGLDRDDDGELTDGDVDSGEAAIFWVSVVDGDEDGATESADTDTDASLTLGDGAWGLRFHAGGDLALVVTTYFADPDPEDFDLTPGTSSLEYVSVYSEREDLLAWANSSSGEMTISSYANGLGSGYFSGLIEINIADQFEEPTGEVVRIEAFAFSDVALPVD